MKWMLLLAVVVMIGCGSTSAAKGRVSYDAGMVAASESAEWDMAEPAREEPVPTQVFNLTHAVAGPLVPFVPERVGTPEELAGTPRLLIYSGSFTVAVGNVEEAQAKAREMAEGLGGYFQSLSKDTITLRVPAARWDEAVAAVGDLGRVLDRAIDAADVTEEVIDLRLRLRNAQKLMTRLEELLARAETVEAALKVEIELGRVREQVERIAGRLQYLGDRIAFSTLVIRFRPVQEAVARPQALPFPWLSTLSLEGLLGLPGGGR